MHVYSALNLYSAVIAVGQLLEGEGTTEIMLEVNAPVVLVSEFLCNQSPPFEVTLFGLFSRIGLVLMVLPGYYGNNSHFQTVIHNYVQVMQEHWHKQKTAK